MKCIRIESCLGIDFWYYKICFISSAAYYETDTLSNVYLLPDDAEIVNVYAVSRADGVVLTNWECCGGQNG